MRRREFITLLGGVAAVWPMAARAQQAMPVVGYVGDSPVAPEFRRAFQEGLNETGFSEGRNVTIEYRWTEGQNDRLPALVADLVRRPVNVIAATSGTSAVAAKAATATIPVVFQMAFDPVAMGLVASLNRPGGNLTGVTSMGVELVPKRLELMRDLVPAATAVAVLVNPLNPNVETIARNVETAARSIGLKVHVLRAGTEREIDAAFANLRELQASGLVIGNDPFFLIQRAQIADLALRHKTPVIFQNRESAKAGGLMSYGADLTTALRLVGNYVGRVLKSEKPGDLPVQQSTKIELIINLKTAKALGLEVPTMLLARATEVIE
jgi:putative ABC transport system substrate-binding protein